MVWLTKRKTETRKPGGRCPRVVTFSKQKKTRFLLLLELDTASTWADHVGETRA